MRAVSSICRRLSSTTVPTRIGRGQSQPEKPQLHVGDHHGQCSKPLGEDVDEKHGAAMAETGTQQTMVQMATIGIEG